MNRAPAELIALPRDFWLRIILAWLVVACIIIGRNLAAIRGLEFGDPDDALRLVQVRDLLAGQGWFELHQFRINPPEGVATHWSRLVDVPLVAFILLLRPLLGQAGAELAASVIVPLLTLLCAMALSARIAGRLLGHRAAYASCLAWVMALPALTQLQPMRIDHHGWQIVAVLGAINAMLVRDPRQGGWIVGLSLAAGLSISLELLPFTALFAGVFALRWLRDPAASAWLKHMVQALAGGSIGFYALTRGPSAAESHCDVVSPAYLAGFVLAAMLISALAALPKLSRPALVGLFGLVAGVTAACYLLLAPQCLTGPYAQLDPVVRAVWYVNVLEGLPVWKHDLPITVQMVVPPLAGLAALAFAYGHVRDLRRDLLGEVALLLGGALVIAALVSRFSGVTAALATVPLGYVIAEWLRRASAMRLAGRLALVPLIMLALLPGYAVGQARAALSWSEATKFQVRPVNMACSLPRSIPALQRIAPTTIFAPLDVSPALLMNTRHKVIATGHHRASAAMRDVIDAYRSDPALAEVIVRAHQADYVIACADLVEAHNYSRFGPKGLMARLLADRAPTWLEPVPLPAAAGALKVWKVRPVAAQAARNNKASPLMQ